MAKTKSGFTAEERAAMKERVREMKASANGAEDGKVVCHFQDAGKFKMSYATLGFGDKAKLDDGDMWPIAFALKEMTPDVEARIVALVKQASS
jgi:hypothetical protein